MMTKLWKGVVFAIILGLFAESTNAQTQCVTTAVAGGTADALTVPSLPCAYTTNLLVLTAQGANATTSPTLSMGGQTPQPIYKFENTPLAAGDIGGSGFRALLTPTGSSWILLNPQTYSNGGIVGPGTTVVGRVPQWGNTSGTVLGTGLPVGTTGVSTIIETGAGGQLAAGVMPALSGDCTTVAGNVTTTCLKTNGVAFGSAAVVNTGVSGATVPLNNSGFTQSGLANFIGGLQINGTALALPLSAVNGGSGEAGIITGALKGNGTSAYTQAACADLTNGATGCSTAVGTSGATIPLNNANNTSSGNQTHSGTENFTSQLNSTGDVLITGASLNGADQVSQVAVNGVFPVTGYGAISSTASPSVTVTGANSTISCTSGCSDFKVGQSVIIEPTSTGGGAGPTSSLSQPSIAVQPTTLDGTLYLPTNGCTSGNTVATISLSAPSTVRVNNTKIYAVGDSITIAGAGASGAALTATITAVAPTAWQYTIATPASTAVTLAAITGFNCATTWRYQVAKIDVNGGKSQASNVVTTASGALNLTPSNYNTITTAYDAAATAYLLYGCKGVSCTPVLIDIEMPNQTWNSTGDPLLMTFSASRSTPSTIYFHDFGMPYVNDSFGGVTAPSAATNQALFAKITGVSGTSITLNAAPTNGGTFTMRHDNGPAFQAAIVAACNGHSVAIPPGSYDLASTFSTNGANCFGSSFTGYGSSSTSAAFGTSRLNWVGPVGGVLFNASGMTSSTIGGFSVTSNFGQTGVLGATPGIAIDFDQIGGPSASRTVFNDISVLGAGIGARLCNGGGNCDFMKFDHVVLAQGVGYGLYANSSTMLGEDFVNFDFSGKISVFSTATGGNLSFSHGEIGEFWNNNFFGGVGFWARSFSSLAYSFFDIHSEYSTKFYYAAGDNAEFQVNIVDSRLADMPDWDGYFVRLGSGNMTLSAVEMDVGGAQVGSLGPLIFAEAAGSVEDAGTGNYASYPTLVGGGGTYAGLGSLFTDSGNNKHLTSTVPINGGFFNAGAGSAATPSVTFGSATEGFFQSTSTHIGWASGGTQWGYLGNGNASFGGNISRALSGGGTPAWGFYTNAGSSAGGLGVFNYQNSSTQAPYIALAKSKSNALGTAASVSSGDQLGVIDVEGSDGVSFNSAANIIVTAGGSVSTGIVPGAINIETANSSGSLTSALTIDDAQNVSVVSGVLSVPAGTQGAPSVTIGASGDGFSQNSSHLLWSVGGSYWGYLGNGNASFGGNISRSIGLGSTPAWGFYTADTSNVGGLGVFNYQNSATQAPYVSCAKSKSNTLGTAAAVASGDQLCIHDFEGSDGAAFQSAAQIVVTAGGAVSVGVVPGAMAFKTANPSGTMTEAMAIDDGQNVKIDNLSASLPVFTDASKNLTTTAPTQTANTVYAGPTTGSASSPTFRALVGADLPNPSASTLGGVQSLAAVSHNFLTSISTSGVPAQAQPAFTDISGTLAGGQLPATGGNGSGAEQTISFQPGLLTSVTNTKGVFGKFVKSSTVDNIETAALLLSCVTNPTITLYECDTDATCASPTTIGTATATAAGQAFDGTITNAAITAGHYVAWAISAGTCTSLDISATAQVHAN